MNRNVDVIETSGTIRTGYWSRHDETGMVHRVVKLIPQTQTTPPWFAQLCNRLPCGLSYAYYDSGTGPVITCLGCVAVSIDP